MRRFARALVVVVVLVVTAGVYRSYRAVPDAPQVATLPVTEGNVVEQVSATGTVAATRTVDVGTLVSGMVKHMDVDFNSVVHAGEVIAELDTATFQTQLGSAQAAVEKGQIDLTGHQENVVYDTQQLERARELFASGLASQQDVDDARIVVVQDEGQVADDRAAITLAQSAVQLAEVNLAHCTITSPVDGVVIARNADDGQTVQSSAAASSLYTIATNLTTVDVFGNIDEADIAKVRQGEDVKFTVAAYPRVVFHGAVTEVRLNATSTSDVVIYQAVVHADNPDLRLRPGMTTNLLVQTSESDGVLRVPNAALRFRPASAVFTALHEPAPPPSRLVLSGAVDTEGQVWIFDHQQLRRVPVRLGVTDGTWTALQSGDLAAGEPVVTNIVVR